MTHTRNCLRRILAAGSSGSPRQLARPRLMKRAHRHTAGGANARAAVVRHDLGVMKDGKELPAPIRRIPRYGRHT